METKGIVNLFQADERRVRNGELDKPITKDRNDFRKIYRG